MFVEHAYNNNKKKENEMNTRELRQVDKQLTRGLLDIIILELIRSEPMHGYKVITSIRKNFGTYFGPSTIYPLLAELQKKGHVKSQWDTNNERPRKVFSITSEGNSILTGIEQSFTSICSQLNRMGMHKIPTLSGQPEIMSSPLGVR